MLFSDVDERTHELEENNYEFEADISTDCEVFESSKLIEEETVIMVTDSDPHLNIYIPFISQVKYKLKEIERFSVWLPTRQL